MAGIDAFLGKIEKVALGTIAVEKISIGANEVWAAIVRVTAMAMTKAGTQNVPAQATILTGFTAGPGAVAADIADGSGLVVRGVGTVTAAVQVINQNSFYSLTATVLKNGVQVQAFSATTGNTSGTTTPFTVAVGDVLTVRTTHTAPGSLAVTSASLSITPTT